MFSKLFAVLLLCFCMLMPAQKETKPLYGTLKNADADYEIAVLQDGSYYVQYIKNVGAETLTIPQSFCGIRLKR